MTAIWMFSVFLLGYFLKSPQAARESVKNALSVCANALIPSLFPFAVLVGIMNSSGLSLAVSRLIGAPVSRLLGIRREAVSAVLLSALGGFPMGAVCVRRLLDERILTKDEAERLLMFTSTASPAFCVGALGLSMFGDAGFGLKLYICQLAAAFLTAVITKKGDIGISSTVLAARKAEVSDLLTGAITEGGMTMLKVCSFTVFFAVVGDAVCLICESCAGSTLAAAFASFCELTLAGRRCAALGGQIGKILCGFAVGYSGLSVHMQTAAVMNGSGVSLRKYHVAKAAQGIFCAAAAAFFC